MALDARIPASMTNFYVWLTHLSNQVMFWVTTISFAVIQTAKKLASGYYQSERQLWVKDQTIDEVGDQFRLRVEFHIRSREKIKLLNGCYGEII